MTIKHFQIEFDTINTRNIFTNGDAINGRILLEASKKTKIQSLVFIATGKASLRLVNCYREVMDREDGSDNHVHLEKIRYYCIKQDILKEGEEDGREVIEKGMHVFPFSFKLSNSQKIPSSFSSTFGQIVHTLKAELKQSMQLTIKAKTHFTFVCKAARSGLMARQHGSKRKKISLGSGMVSMDVYTSQRGYKPGETLRVHVEIENLSSRSVKPKFVLDVKKSFLAVSRAKIQKHEILKEKSDTVNSFSGKKTLIKQIIIPQELSPSILNCSIIKLEYRLKVYLQITCEAHLVVKLPIVIMPELLAENPSRSSRFEAFESSNEPSWMMQTAEPPPSYEESAQCPPFRFGV